VAKTEVTEPPDGLQRGGVEPSWPRLASVGGEHARRAGGGAPSSETKNGGTRACKSNLKAGCWGKTREARIPRLTILHQASAGLKGDHRDDWGGSSTRSLQEEKAARREREGKKSFPPCRKKGENASAMKVP